MSARIEEHVCEWIQPNRYMGNQCMKKLSERTSLIILCDRDNWVKVGDKIKTENNSGTLLRVWVNDVLKTENWDADHKGYWNT